VKASIVAECYSGRDGVSAVARRHGLDPSQVYAWRRDLRKQLEAKGDPAFGRAGSGRVRACRNRAQRGVRSCSHAASPPSTSHRSCSCRAGDRRCGVKIGRSADVGVIAAVIEALKATR
jgi:transposase